MISFLEVREWYCWHFPELRDLVPDGIAFCRCASLIGDRSTLVTGDERFVQNRKEELEDILGMYFFFWNLFEFFWIFYQLLIYCLAFYYVLNQGEMKKRVPKLSKQPRWANLPTVLPHSTILAHTDSDVNINWKVSMGMDASPIDMLNVVTFTDRMVKLADYRRQLYS